jgi:hypothetical protein
MDVRRTWILIGDPSMVDRRLGKIAGAQRLA